MFDLCAELLLRRVGRIWIEFWARVWEVHLGRNVWRYFGGLIVLRLFYFSLSMFTYRPSRP